MTDKNVEILLVEDNPNDEMLALYAFKKHNLDSKVYVVRDGEEALDWIFCTGVYADRHFENPRVILLDKGQIDDVVPRASLRATTARLLRHFQGHKIPAKAAVAA